MAAEIVHLCCARMTDSDKVIDLLSRKRHFSGRVVCLACNHEWVGVAATGSTGLECPQCHCMRGVWKFPLMPAESRLVYQCNCGCTAFFVMLKEPDDIEIMCHGCGAHTVMTS